MDRDVTAFRERFNAYKNGKSVSEIYDAGLPRYANGTPNNIPAYQRFVEEMGPVLFNEMIVQGVKNPKAAYKNMITQLAYESNYGQSKVAREQNNFGGVGWNGKTYTTYKDKADFAKNYVRLMNSRYKNVISADTLAGYAKGLKGLNYYEDSLENYTRNLTGMKSFAKALDAHMSNNPDLYNQQISVQEPSPYITRPVSTAVRPTIPQEQTKARWDGAEQVSPYVTGKPMVKLRPRVQLPDLIELMEDSEWEPPFQLTPRGYKNGKLPEYKDGTRYLWDDQKGEWDRITDSDVANAMAQWAFTPTTTRAKFNYENTPNPVKPLSKNAVVKQDDDLWTRQQVEKANNTRTWRSDVADVLHNIGEGTMLASTFAAPEIEPLVYPTYQMAKGSIQQAIKQHAAPYLVSALMRPKPQYITPVINRFRNQEWSNFLQTVNGDNYYRIARDASALNTKEKYFISHTTPWEEFTRFGENNNGAGRLYEFPTKTFGRLNSTDYKGVKSVHDVTEMGKRHLLYGNTASGPRGQVRLLSDNDAETIGVDPFVTGLTERPLGQKGMYDARPIYDDIYMGNQTTIKGRRFNEAVVNAPHSEYYPTEGGVQRVLHTSDNPLHNYGITPDWKNPKNNALSVEQQDAMLGEYVGKGAERQVFDDRRFPVGRRVIKIGGGVNGEEKIYNFDQLRDAVEYAMEINKLPNVPPMSYEGFTSEGGQLIPWFSQEKVLPMKKIADPFQTFSKKPILPNGKTASNKLSAIRRIDSDKIFSPIGYKPVLNMPARYRVDGYPYTIGDLGQKNIGFDVFGNLKIFDPMIDL